MSSTRLAGAGGIVFGLVTYAGIDLSRAVGGGYDRAAVARYLAPGRASRSARR
jgi:hypothetical protein